MLNIAELNYKIINDDCLNALKDIPDNSIDAVVTSPPYAMQRKKLYGGIPEDEYPEWTVRWMQEVKRLLKPSGSVLINIREHIRNGEMSDYVHRTRMALRAAGWVECDELIWVKPASPPVGRVDRPRRSWERILWFAQTGSPACYPKNEGKIGLAGFNPGTINARQWVSGLKEAKEGIVRTPDYISIAVGTDASKVKGIAHPAKYPIKLAAWMIRLITPPGGIVLDPFAGSGTTLIAAQREGFNAIGIEIMPEYCEIIRSRLEAAANADNKTDRR